MNVNVLRLHWMQLRGDIKARWDKINDDELDIINRSEEALIARLQKLYGLTEQEATDQVVRFLDAMAAKYEPVSV